MGAHRQKIDEETETSDASAASGHRIASPLPPTAPTRRVGPFFVGAELARGGMASVHVASVDPAVRAREACPEPPVFAIKLVLPELVDEPDFVEMFLDEARIASSLKHPNACRVFRFGEVDDTLFLTMELLRGAPLGALRRAGVELAREADPRWHRVVARCIADACAGLHAAHELTDADGHPLHVVHRDVSPQNVFVGRDGVTKILDFGIASAEHRLHKTNVGVVKGKFAYIAPEQILSSGSDRRADVWSIGVVLWELLAGRTLFRRSQEHETIGAVLRPVVPTIDGVPSALFRVAWEALVADPARRTPTADAVRRALEAWLDTVGGCDRADVAAAMEAWLPDEPTVVSPAPPPPPAPKRSPAERAARSRDATVPLSKGPRTSGVSARATPATPPGRNLARLALLALLVALAVWSLGHALGERISDSPSPSLVPPP